MGSIRTKQEYSPVLIARRNAAQTLTNGVANTLSFDTEILDIFNAWDGTTWTVPALGIYSLELSGNFISTGTVTAIDVSVDLALNSSASTNRRFGNRLVYDTAITPVSFSATVPVVAGLAVGNAVTIRATVNFTGATTVTWGGTYCSLCISKFG